MKNILVGGVLAGVVLFLWGAVAHMLLPIGQMGMQELPHSTSVTYALDLALEDPGLYVFPWMDPEQEMSKKALADWEEAYRDGPVGFILYRPHGGEPMSARKFVLQFATDIVAGLLVAVLLSFTALSFAGRLLFVTAVGAFSWITSSIPWWNWYGFPQDFVVGAGIYMIVGWFLAGLVLAALGDKTSSSQSEP
ncbi:hypothetical protein [Thiolapillus sp.]